MTEMEVQMEILNKIIKKTIRRIKELQKQLEVEKQDLRKFGYYADCSPFYQEMVIKKAVISELISQKIYLEKWKKKIKFQIA